MRHSNSGLAVRR